MAAAILLELEQIQLLQSRPFEAEGFDWHRPIPEQIVERYGRIKRLRDSSARVIESYCCCDGTIPDRPRVYDLDGKPVPADPDSTLPEADFLRVFEAWCVDAMIAKGRERQDVTAAWLRVNAPKGDEIARAAGKTRSRCSTWIHRHMPLKDALAIVLPGAAEKAAAILAERAAEKAATATGERLA